MQLKSLQMKRALRNALLVLLLIVAGMEKGYAQNFDFSTVCSTGQTLYYRYIEATNDVQLVPPNYSPGQPPNWDGYDKPTGNLVISELVNYNGITYSVTTIGGFAFSYCWDLISVTIPNSVTEIGYEAFAGCTGLTSVTIGNFVTMIGDGAFTGCTGLISITIPNSVIFLSRNAFYNTGWYVQQPDGILYLDNCCLGYKGQKPIGELRLQEGTRLICEGAFDYCIGFTGTLTIPNSVTVIGDGAFEWCTGFTGSLTIPNSVIYIGERAFQDCSGFTDNLTIGNSVTTIGDDAFAGCKGFTGSLTISNSVTTISSGTFEDCSGFTGSLTIPHSVTTIGDDAFAGCSGFTGSLTIPNSVTTIGHSAFCECSGFTGSLTIPNSVTEIGRAAFEDCSGFTGPLTIPYSVTTINAGAFNGCTSFTSLTIPNSVTEIGKHAFGYCSGLNEVYFNAINCDDIDIPIWSDCSGITTIVIGDAVETIVDGLFYGLENLTSVSIGKSVKYIGEEAFAHNPRLNMVYYNVEKDLEAPAPYSFNNNQYTAFYNCPNLTTIHIGADVQEIGSDIFKGCNTVHFVVALGPTPAVLDAGAFSDIVDNSVLMVSCGNRVTYYSVWNMFPYNNIIEDCNTYLVSVGVNGTGGSVTSSASSAQMGQTVTLTVTPNPGMVLASLKACNANDATQIIPISSGNKAASTYQFTMPPFEVVVVATFTTSNTSVEENATFSIPASVYPNPTMGYVKVEAENIKHISISNMLGQMIFDSQTEGDTFEYDFSGQKAGIYLIRVETPSGVAVKKVSLSR